MNPQSKVIIIGAGPAGLTAGYLLAKRGIAVTILEEDPKYVGGISRTVQYKGFRFDIGGHRFFSKSSEVEALWSELLPDDMLTRDRSSRIYFQGKLFDYPLRPLDALSKLGLVEACLCVLSYIKRKLFPYPQTNNFQEWVSNRFGDRLFRIFFKTYTEKVWGMSCTDISADWAAQRIHGLSLFSAIFSAFFPKNDKNRGSVIKTLINQFRYPRLGPGMMWEACADKIRALGGEIRMGAHVSKVHFDSASGEWRVTCRGSEETISGSNLISTTAMQHLAMNLTPDLSGEAISAAKKLRYRDFLLVALVIKDRDAFNDNWIYIHDPLVKVGRIQNFKSWSPHMVPDPDLNCYGLEYFCNEGDQIWSMGDDELKAMATRELASLGLGQQADVIDGCVVRQRRAYPVYDPGYRSWVEKLAGELETRFPTLHLVGRNGMHKYNNQDHAMMTAMLSVENIVAGKRLYDTWRVNQDAEYHESGTAGGKGELLERLVPQAVSSKSSSGTGKKAA